MKRRKIFSIVLSFFLLLLISPYLSPVQAELSEPEDLSPTISEETHSPNIGDDSGNPVSSSEAYSPGCSDGHDCISVSYNSPIDEDQGLELWVKFKNGHWKYSDNLNDLLLVRNNQTISMVVLKNRFGAAGFYVDDTGKFSHGQVIVAPVLENGTQLRDPLAGVFFKLYVRKGENIYSNYLTSRGLGYDYRNFFEIDDEDGWRLGWHIDEMVIQGDTFDIYLGIQMTEDSRRAKIEHRIIPRSRSFDDIGIEYLIINNPKFQGTDFEIDKIWAWGENDYAEINLDNEIDIKTVPNWVEEAKLLTKNNLVVHTFDFYDIAQQGLSTAHWRIQNKTLPNGDWTYVVRTLFNKNSPIAQDETLNIDPGMSVSETAETVSVESSGVYNVTLQGPVITSWFDLKNDPDKSDEMVYGWGKFGLRYLKNGSSFTNIEYDSPNMTIVENSPTKVVLKVETYYSDGSQNILMYNGIKIREHCWFTFYSDGRIFIKRSVLDEVNPITDEDLFYDVRSYSWSKVFWGNESDLNIEDMPASREYYYTNALFGLDWSRSDWYLIANSSFQDYYDSDGSYNEVEHPAGTYVFSVKDVEPVGLWASDVVTPVTQIYMINLGHDPLDDDASFTKTKELAGDYMHAATFSNIDGGSFNEWNYTYGVYNFTSTAIDYLNFTINAGSYPRNYTVFQVHNWTVYGTSLAVNDTTYTETGFLNDYNSTSDVLVVWLNSSVLGEIRNPTNISLADYGPPIINLVSPSNNSVVKDGAIIDLNIIEVHYDIVLYNWDGNSNSTLSDPFDITVSDLNDGNRTLNVYANDTLGYSSSKVYQFEVDNIPPSINLNSPANGSFVEYSDTIDLNVYDLNLYSVLYNWNGDTNSSLEDPFDVNAPTDDGNYILNVYSADTAGNWNSSILQFKIDNVAPYIDLGTPFNESVVSDGTIIDVNIADGYSGLDEGTEGEAGEYTHIDGTTSDETTIVQNGIYSIYLYCISSWSSHRRNITAPFYWGNFTSLEISTYITEVGWEYSTTDLMLELRTEGSAYAEEWVDVTSYDVWETHVMAKDVFDEYLMDDGTLVTAIYLKIPCTDWYIYVDNININLDSGDNLDKTWYNWNDGANSSFSDPWQLTIGGLSEGNNTLNVYANDTNENENTKTYQFDVENPPVISLIGPLNGSSISILSTIILNVTDDTNVSTVLYNWDGGTNNSLTSPYYLYMPFDSFGHNLYVYSNDTYNNWGTNTFYWVGLAGAGATGGGGGGGNGEQEAFVVDIEYPVTFVVDDTVQITVKVNDTKGKPVSDVSVIARYEGRVLVFKETTSGVYVVDVPNYVHLGVNDFTVIVSKTGYATYEKRITIRGYESEADVPLILFPANWMTNIWIYYGQTLITVIVVIIGVTSVLYVANRKGLIELPQIGIRKLKLPDIGIERRKLRKPSLPSRALPSRKFEKALFADRKGVGMNWMVFALASIGISVWMLGSLFTSPQAAGAIWFYAFSLAVPLIVVSLYISWRLGEKSSYEPDELTFRSEDPFGAIIYGVIILVPVSMLLFTISTYLATGINPFVMAPLHKQQTIEFPWGALSGFLVNIFLQFIVAAGENIALLILPTLIFDLLGVENRKGQMILSASAFSAFHYFAAMRTVGIVFMFPYFFVGGCIFWLCTFGMEKGFKFPQGGFIAGFAVHLIANLMTISSASVLFV